MIALLEYENSKLPKEQALERLYDRMDVEKKAMALSREGFALLDRLETRFGKYVALNDKPINSIGSLEKLNSMTPHEQINNPIAIASFAAEKGIDPREVLYYPDAFEEWLYSSASLKVLPIETQDASNRNTRCIGRRVWP